MSADAGAGRDGPQAGADLQHHDQPPARAHRLVAGGALRAGGHGIDGVLLAAGVQHPPSTLLMIFRRVWCDTVLHGRWLILRTGLPRWRSRRSGWWRGRVSGWWHST